MMMYLRTGLLILLISVLAACGGGGSSDLNGKTRTAQPDDTTTPDVPDAPTTTPVAVDLTTNIFFPVFDGMALYYNDDVDPAVLGETQTQGATKIYPLVHVDEQTEYLTSTATEVGLKGVNLPIIQGLNPVFIELMFDDVRTILGNASSYSTSGNAELMITGSATPFSLPVALVATQTANEVMSVQGLGDQPARVLTLTLRLQATLQQKIDMLAINPGLLLLLTPFSIDLSMIPGVGIAEINALGRTWTINHVDNIPQPHVFTFSRNTSVNNIAAQQIEFNGAPVTDDQWETTVYYRTTGADWLDVSFDATGSWRASITRTDLAEGVYAATVRFVKGDVTQDATVSILVL